MDCFNQTLAHVQIRVLSERNKNQDGRQNGCCLSMCAVVVTLSLFLMGFFPNFIFGLLPSNSSSSSNTSFVLQTITKMANKMAAAYQFALVDTLL